MKVPNLPGSGKDTAEGKGVHREVKSEERIRQNSGLLHLRLNAGIRLPNKLKSDNCTKLYLVSIETMEKAEDEEPEQAYFIIWESCVFTVSFNNLIKSLRGLFPARVL